MTPLDIDILAQPRPASGESVRQDSRPAAWRWRYCDPRSGEWVDPSEPLTPDEVIRLNPSAELIPGTRSERPETPEPFWR